MFVLMLDFLLKVGAQFAIYFDCLGYKVYSVQHTEKPIKYPSLLEIVGGHLSRTVLLPHPVSLVVFENSHSGGKQTKPKHTNHNTYTILTAQLAAKIYLSSWLNAAISSEQSRLVNDSCKDLQ